MTVDMAEETDWTPRSKPESHRWSPLGAAKRLSDRTSLRTKLITSLLVLVIMALAAIGVASTYMLRSYVTHQQDSNISGVIQYFNAGRELPQHVNAGYASPTHGSIVLGVQIPGSQLNWDPSVSLPGLDSPDPLPKLPTGVWPGPNPADLSGIRSVPAQSGPNTWRVLGETVTLKNTATGAQSTGILVVAVDIGNLNQLTQRLVLFDLLVGGAIVVVLAAVGVGVVRSNLRPLNDIELTAGQIAAGHLDHRVPEGDPRTEIGSLGRSLNAMLAQIERAFHAQGEAEQAAHQSEERMRRFIADAAHELRTPLTTIRGFAAHYRLRGGSNRLHPGAPGPQAGTSAVDDALLGAEDNPVLETAADSSEPVNDAARGGVAPEGLSPDELDRLMGRVESEATRMGVLVEDLLTLARLDQQRPLNRTPVDLLTLAADAVQDARVVQPGRPIDLIVAPGTAFLIDGDEPRLRQVLANLVNNAITHTPAGTPIRVKIARGNLEARSSANRPAGTGAAKGATGQTQGPRPAGAAVLNLWADGTDTADARERVVPAVVIDVEDDGPGMSIEQAQRVFERFYRADAARNRASGGTGLGLAIVAGLVSAHGGTVSVRTAPGKGADFQVKLPLSPDALATDDPDAEDDLLA
jgi:two-component system OmpR family sensor kinase